jgi:hypothetical protein
MSITLTTDLTKLDNRIRLLTSKNLSYMLAKALSETGKITKDKLKTDMSTYIDKPNPWTLGSAYVRFAKPSDLSVEVGIASENKAGRTAAGKYLMPIIQGTKPRPKAADLSAAKVANVSNISLTPSNVRLNTYGNVTLQSYIKILSEARNGGGKHFIAPIKQGSNIKAVFIRAGRGGKGTRRVFTLDPLPKPRRAQFPLMRLLEQHFMAAWPKQVQIAYKSELQNRL